MGREFEGIRGVLARRSRATSGGESIGGAGPHLQRLGVGAGRVRSSPGIGSSVAQDFDNL